MNKTIVVFILFTVILVGYVYISTNLEDTSMDSCGKMIAISNSKEKINYIKNWAKSAIDDKGLLLRLGPSAHAYANRGFDRFKKFHLGINWEYLSLDEKYAFVYLDGKVDGERDYMDPGSIWSVVIGEGRDSVIIDIGDVPENALKIRSRVGQKYISEITGVIAWCR
jgi:hypothetical protein